MSTEDKNNDKNTLRDYFQLGEVTTYFSRLFYKKDPNAPSNTNLKLMHGINKISIVIFFLALIVMVTRAILR